MTPEEAAELLQERIDRAREQLVRLEAQVRQQKRYVVELEVVQARS